MALAVGLAAAAVASAEPPGPSFQGVGDAAGGGFMSRALGVSPNGVWVAGATEVVAAGGGAPAKTEAFRWSDGTLETLGRIVLFDHNGFLAGTTTSEAVSVADLGSPLGGTGCQTPDLACPARLCLCVPILFRPGGNASVVEPTTSLELYLGGSGSDVDGAGSLFLLENTTAVNLEDTTEVARLVDTFTLDPGWFLGGGLFVEISGLALSPDAGWASIRLDDLMLGTGVFLSELGIGSQALDLDHPRAVAHQGAAAVGSKAGEAALWQGGTTTSLGDFAGGATASEALGVSDGGAVVVGWGTSAAGEEAFYWTSSGGLQRLADVLAAEGLDLGSWTLRRATGVSRSGRTVVGWGTNPGGDTEGFVARLPEPTAVPASGPHMLALLGVLLTACPLLLSRVRRARAEGRLP